MKKHFSKADDTKAVAAAQDPLGEANRNVKEVTRRADKTIC